ncbi:Glycosyltransferase family 10 (fucosyltransferase) C-term [Butyrivibrio fibrisolvens]|uniref:Glycosyltransferase family 10 (Fucosyltransferase) C-term n=1 Tax=Butyrivibrio fibrisolvens TaxID=831 RepID=A0A1H9WVQ1_BUTFI|nr:glycosyltransferase family 10 [Butyrivibrio fibrisolvens]SES37925.1 Glycosyltransferase family 10 (fucosyltransferase) C-term [Butyrivibrio fibrisolvens]
MNMKKISIAFEDFFKGFDPYNNVIYRLLKDKYDVEVIDISDKEQRSKVQYLFFSVFGNNYLEYDCIRIFISGENLCPNFNLCDYAIGFEYMDFEDRYIRFPIYLWDMYQADYNRLLDNKDNIGESPEKRKFCGIVVSNNLFSDPMREDFFNELSKYKRVDSGGRAFNNIGKPDGVEDKNQFLCNYKFSIAFENSSYSGYCTEKLMQAFSSGTVPIYWGDPRAIEVFNKGAYIDCTGLSISEAIEKVKAIDNDDEAYLRMLSCEPLVDRKHREKMEEALLSWLENIFDQDVAKAKRIPKYGKMAIYEQNYYKKVKMEKMIKKPKAIYAIVKKIFIRNS